MKFSKSGHGMKCKKCGDKFPTANSWGLCLDCYVDYANSIPDHIPKEQHQKYLFDVIRGLHEI